MYPCTRLHRTLKIEQETDTFISHRPALANLEFIREHGMEEYLAHQQERATCAGELIASYNNGRLMTFYCTACALLPVRAVRLAMRRAATPMDPAATPKERVAKMRGEIQATADRLGTDLRLRRSVT